MQVPDADGWVSVERPETPTEEFEEEKGVWVVVSKKIGDERFLVRFPEDPLYHSFPGGIEWTAAFNSDLLSLRVENREDEKDLSQFVEERLLFLNALPETFLIKSSAHENAFDLFYRHEGKWVWEKIMVTPHFVYLFQTKSEQMSGNTHRQFTISFDASK